MPSRRPPLPCRTAISPLSSGWNQRSPIFQSGPPNSSPRGGRRRLLGTAPPATASGRMRWSSHQSARSETNNRLPSRSHSTWQTDSSRSPTRGRTPVNPPVPSISASMTTVPSHGIRGWSQAIQAARRPSWETLGPVTNRCRSSESSRTAARSSAAEPSSGTAATTRRTSVGAGPVNSSSTHQTSPAAPCSGRTCGSAQRSPPPTSDTGVSGHGAAGPSGAYAYSRWSAKWTNTTRSSPLSRTVPAQGWPPYSITRLRMFQGAGSTGAVVPSARRRIRARRPFSAGRGSVHHTSSPRVPRWSGRPSCEAASAASTGDGQVPYGAAGTVFTLVGPPGARIGSAGGQAVRR